MQRNSVSGTRSSLLWLLILVVVVVLIGAVVGVLVILPQQQASRAEQARLAEVERHYLAGVAFQGVDDWTSAEGEYKQVIALDAGYKDVMERLASVRARLQENASSATAVAVAQAERMQTDTRATVQAAPSATQQALDTHYQKGVGYMNIGRWTEAKSELEVVFESDPNYRDVQAQLALVNAELLRLTPTATSTPLVSPTPSQPPTPRTVRSSHFDGTATDGWAFLKGAMINPGTGGSGGGSGNGCLIVTEDKGGTSGYFMAPAKYHGSWSAYSELRVDLWSSGGTYYKSSSTTYGDIYLASGYATAERLLGHRPANQWETFVVDLRSDDGWAFGGGARTLSDILVNVTDFQIRGEYGDGSDECGLDNVALVE